MSFISAEEIKTHMAADLVDAISGEDDTLLAAAIDGAEAEVKSYLPDFDLATIFAETGDDRHALLVIFVKDVAVWHFLALCNAGVELPHREKRYNAAIAWLKGVKSGDIVPDLAKVTATDEISATVTFGSNVQRVNHI